MDCVSSSVLLHSVSSGLGIPPSRPKPESENVDIVLHKPLVQAAPALSLVDYGPEPDAQEEEEEVPDPDEKAEPGITEVVSLLEEKENSQDGMVGEGYMYCTAVGEGYMYCTVVGKGYMYCTVVGEGYMYCTVVGEGYIYSTVVGEGYMYCTVVGEGYMYCTVVGEGYMYCTHLEWELR